jgi:hypothetical protein
VATQVYEPIEIQLLDGSSITIKPISIKNLRVLMKSWSKAADVKTEDEFIDVLLECSEIAMKQFDPSLTKEKLEEVLDLQTMYKVLEVAADLKLNDPNLLAEAQAVVGKNLT